VGNVISLYVIELVVGLAFHARWPDKRHKKKKGQSLFIVLIKSAFYFIEHCISIFLCPTMANVGLYVRDE
jgi:hypothetical protein